MSEYKKKSTGQVDQEQRISRAMYASIKSFIGKFSDEDEMLMATASAKKVKGCLILTMFDLSDIERYEKKFIKSHIIGIHDAFIFEKLAKSGSSFIPAMFWMSILKQNVL